MPWMQRVHAWMSSQDIAPHIEWRQTVAGKLAVHELRGERTACRMQDTQC
jgi:hypothetical protein